MTTATTLKTGLKSSVHNKLLYGFDSRQSYVSEKKEPLVNTATQLHTLFNYSVRANDQLIEASAVLTDDQLDRSFEMGRATLRKTLIHILAGESVWLGRCKGEADTRWLDEEAATPVSEIARELRQIAKERDGFLESIDDGDMDRTKKYLDVNLLNPSARDYYVASLRNMLIQGFVHSVHHRAQAVNMLRRIGVDPPEVDYMVSVRKPEP